MEVLFYDLVSDAELVGLIEQGRRMLGDGIQMALDLAIAGENWHDAKWVLDRIVDCDIFFAEATLQHDDLDGHARLSESSSIRICGAEAGSNALGNSRMAGTRQGRGRTAEHHARRRLDRNPPQRRALRVARR
jgi:hypothetical protein